MQLTPLKLAHQIIESAVAKGETVVDATIGNGHDALFLAKLVGDNGLLIGFDIQEKAVESTHARLLQHGIKPESFQLHLCGHENLQQHTN